MQYKLEVFLEVSSVEPSDLVVGCPEFASLVDVDLTSLLSVSFAKLTADPVSTEAAFEDPTFAAEVGSTCETESASQMDFSWVKHVAIGIIGQVEGIIACPIGLESLGIVWWQSRERRAVVGKSVVIDIFWTLGTCFGSSRPTIK